MSNTPFVQFNVAGTIVAVPANLAPSARKFYDMAAYTTEEVIKILLSIPNSFVVR